MMATIERDAAGRYVPSETGRDLPSMLQAAATVDALARRIGHRPLPHELAAEANISVRTAYRWLKLVESGDSWRWCPRCRAPLTPDNLGDWCEVCVMTVREMIERLGGEAG